MHKTITIFFILVSHKLVLAQDLPAEEDFCLPNNVSPSHYALTLDLTDNIFETNTFNGVLFTTFTVLKTTNEIKLHAYKDLEISNINIYCYGSEFKQSLHIDQNEFISNSKEILTIQLSEPILPGYMTYVLKFDYSGKLSTDNMYGFYKSSYFDKNGVKRPFAATYFQPTYARRVFPCFDEPSFKSIFDITIKHPADFFAISNALTERVTPLNISTSQTKFQATPKISTYLVAFVVSDLSCVSIDIGSVCSREDTADSRNLAMTKAPVIMDWLESYTGIKYLESLIGKLDLIAIPNFADKAMENWGLITYSEAALLWDSEESSNRHKQTIQVQIAHEFAQMWFGNLVTPSWWSDLFLNHGLATLFGYFITAEIETLWDMEKQFVLEIFQPALLSDGLPTSISLSSDVLSTDEILNKFNTVYDSKGASIFRMVQNFIGTENFRQGIAQYLNVNKLSTTTPETLWAQLEPFAKNLPTLLVEVMGAWINNPGFPLVQVVLEADSIKISQQNFLRDENPEWYIPITYSVSTDDQQFDDTSIKEWLVPNEEIAINASLLNDNFWIILNNKLTGFYRVNYDDILWRRIKVGLNQPNFAMIHEINRAQIIDDFHILAKNELQQYSEFLDLVLFLQKDTAYTPWYSAFSAFDDMLTKVEDTQLKKLFIEYIVNLMESLYNTAPFVESKVDQIYTHKQVLVQTWACRLGISYCVQKSVTAFLACRNSNIKVDKNLRPVVYCNGLRYSDNIYTDWNFLWGKYNEATVAAEQNVILTALGCATDTDILYQYLEKTIQEDSGIGPQDTLSVFTSVYKGSSKGVDVALEFLIKEFENIDKYYTNPNLFNNLITGIANQLTNQGQLEKLQTFLKLTNLPSNWQLSRQSAIDIATKNLKFVEILEEELTLYFMPTLSQIDNSAATTVTCINVSATLFFIIYHVFY